MLMKSLIKSIVAPIYYRFHGRETGRKLELSFWNDWIESGGLEWGEEFQRRIDSHTPLQWPHNEMVGLLKGREIKVLDVGSGPLTNVGYRSDTKQIVISACDPNADAYNRLLESKNIIPPVRAISAEGESISKVFSGRFDYITCSNALDHARDPDVCISEMLKLVDEDGVIYLSHETNEGVREGYRGYHKWNICMVNDHEFRVWNPGLDKTYKEEGLGKKIFVREQGGMIRIVITNNEAVLEWARKTMLQCP